MRRTTLPALLVAATTLLAGCSGDPDEDLASESPTAAPSARSEGSVPTGEPSAEEPEVDTYADVAGPASVPLDPDLLDGVDAVSIWEGSQVEEDDGLSGGELVLGPGRSLAVLVASRDPALSRGSADAELRYWLRNSVYAREGSAEVLEPVVVDGEELLRARAEDGFLVIDQFFYSTGERTLELTFATPPDLSEAEREKRIGQVMATLELE